MNRYIEFGGQMQKTGDWKESVIILKDGFWINADPLACEEKDYDELGKILPNLASAMKRYAEDENWRTLMRIREFLKDDYRLRGKVEAPDIPESRDFNEIRKTVVNVFSAIGENVARWNNEREEEEARFREADPAGAKLRDFERALRDFRNATSLGGDDDFWDEDSLDREYFGRLKKAMEYEPYRFGVFQSSFGTRFDVNGWEVLGDEMRENGGDPRGDPTAAIEKACEITERRMEEVETDIWRDIMKDGNIRERLYGGSIAECLKNGKSVDDACEVVGNHLRESCRALYDESGGRSICGKWPRGEFLNNVDYRSLARPVIREYYAKHLMDGFDGYPDWATWKCDQLLRGYNSMFRKFCGQRLERCIEKGYSPARSISAVASGIKDELLECVKDKCDRDRSYIEPIADCLNSIDYMFLAKKAVEERYGLRQREMAKDADSGAAKAENVKKQKQRGVRP